jgi:hypothetical protein
MVVYPTMAERKLKSRSFPRLTLRAPSFCSRSEPDQDHEDILVENFTDADRVCLERCRTQVRDRFPPLTVQEMVALLLDPRTKNCAGSIIDSLDCPTMHRERLLRDAESAIIDRQMSIMQLCHSRVGSWDDVISPVSSPPTQYSELSVAQADTAVFFGAPVPTKMKAGFQESHLREEAVGALHRWMHHQEDWVNVVVSQGAKEDRAALSKLMCIKRDDDTVCWNIVELCRVDVLRWFRDVDEAAFPRTAVLARIWLGKASSTAFQERVFSTAGIVMSPQRSQTDNERAEKQLLLRVNRHAVQS